MADLPGITATVIAAGVCSLSILGVELIGS